MSNDISSSNIAMRLAKRQDIPEDVRYALESLAERILCELHEAECDAYQEGINQASRRIAVGQ